MKRQSSPACGSVPRRLGAARGFTLIEVLVVLAILVIGTGIAAPQMTKMMGSNRVQTEASALQGDMQYARTEAIKRGSWVSLCPSADGSTCLTANTWHSGWIIFADVAGNGVYDSAADSPILKVRAATKGGDTIVASPQPSPNAVTFNREGMTANLGTSLVTFTLHTAPTYDPSTRCVLVTFGGKLTTVAKGTSCS
ncbi:MAG: GspH/FimT family pseudopilin [Betaproteobacteria bacterium]